ncbi:hypothetical protein [Pseudomonas sp. PS02288]|uniref:hypothetical protein n=1 Tax=Pseudomonas sp. PS02288 TaxID=2991443 RepID=UPI00249A09BB|nr:hypothetical protein [Pseudomonas sp. PS02288]
MQEQALCHPEETPAEREETEGLVKKSEDSKKNLMTLYFNAPFSGRYATGRPEGHFYFR